MMLYQYVKRAEELKSSRLSQKIQKTLPKWLQASPENFEGKVVADTS